MSILGVPYFRKPKIRPGCKKLPTTSIRLQMQKLTSMPMQRLLAPKQADPLQSNRSLNPPIPIAVGKSMDDIWETLQKASRPQAKPRIKYART